MGDSPDFIGLELLFGPAVGSKQISDRRRQDNKYKSGGK